MKKIYTHEWETVHKETSGFTQATGLELRQKVFKLWKLRVVTHLFLCTGGQYIRGIRCRIKEDLIQSKLEAKRK